MFHYKSLFSDEVGAIRQRGSGLLRKEKKRALKDKSILPVHHGVGQHPASHLQRAGAPWPQCSWRLFGSDCVFRGDRAEAPSFRKYKV